MRKDENYTADKTAYLAIRDWREDERPRERLAKHGANALSDAELLAILISSGTRGFSALDAARELLKRHESLGKLSACDLSEFRAVPGLGNARAIGLAAAFEIGKRIAAEPSEDRKIIRSPEDVAGIYIPRLRGRRNEVFYVLLLNAANQIYREVQVSEGSLNASIVHPREVFRLAITDSAANVILMHNHPSGNPQPSNEDIEITRQLREAGSIIGIGIFDHIIIAGNQFTSLARIGKL
ncbi:MAG: RadC family protein [Candidatus Kapaibacterium sp.]